MNECVYIAKYTTITRIILWIANNYINILVIKPILFSFITTMVYFCRGNIMNVPPIYAAAARQPKNKYTGEQWERLYDYWDHPLFKKTRPFGFIIALFVMIYAIPPICSTRWVTYKVYKTFNYTYSELC